ncbi:TetR family transcriptional regulator [Paracoccus sp. S-4012]|uniref:TetR/AcrR family transcriptional regulator n=1 Tax=Paracoccus sp. S-4012 TaxID=2665648 RepID=UPI0012AFAEC7|nr:TetR/AcrR family transcriptional regulator [Paracoccus sp. S-4012]MRX48946.1 TetR family transcriptional regulator [Paracoccus sp. S-4012]
MTDSLPRSDRPLRSDATRNRAALIDAAARLFAERGFDVPMAEIAAEAGVGRTTLLRNFPTRMELASAIFEQSMGSMRALAARQTGEPGDFTALFDMKLSLYVRNAGLSQAVQKERGESDSFQNERREIADLLLTAARPAIDAGLMRPDVTAEAFMVLQQAMAGAITPGPTPEDRAERARLFRALILDGLMLA